MKFEEINLKFKKLEKVQDNNKVQKFHTVQKSSDQHSITNVTGRQYFHYCNIVELHAVQYTSTRFLIIAYFSNKGYNSVCLLYTSDAADE